MLEMIIKKRKGEGIDDKYEIIKSILIASFVILLEIGIYIYTTNWT